MSFQVEQIVGSEKLMTIFGSWPSFHDGHVDSVYFEPNSERCNLEIVCRIFETTNSVDKHGYFLHQKDTRVKIRFTKIERVELKAIYAGAIIFDLNINPTITEFTKKQGWLVCLTSSTDFEIKLQCVSIEVLEAVLDS